MKTSSMTVFDACKILGITGKLTLDVIKTAFKAAAMKYHPDKGGSLAMMQMVNEAYQVLKANVDKYADKNFQEQPGYGEEVNAAINAIITLNLEIVVAGSWVWVSGSTYQVKGQLKKAGYKFCKKKEGAFWTFRPAGFKSRSKGDTDMDDIFDKYGKHQVTTANAPAMAA